MLRSGVNVRPCAVGCNSDGEEDNACCMPSPGRGGSWWLGAWLVNAVLVCACTRPGTTQMPELDAGKPDAGPDAAEPDARPQPDLRPQLEALPGVVAVAEIPTQIPGYRYFELSFEQPLDHVRSSQGQFEQRVALMHVDTTAPMVLETSGYQSESGDLLSEPAELLKANQLVVEHRFFGDSRPDIEPIPWELLDIDQAARDVHRVVDAFSTLYRQAWVSTGGSKGGMAALFHRQRFPGDVAGTIAYAAPINLGLSDPRYLDFFDRVGAPDCRERLRALQREILLRRPEIIETARTWTAALRFDILGGLERAFEASVVELEWAFWQDHGHRADACERLPSLQATDEELVLFLNDLGLLSYYADAVLLPLQPYYQQVATQLGSPALPLNHLADLLQSDEATLLDLLVPPDGDPTYDPAAMQEARNWMHTEARAIQLIYGENDPWTSGRFGVDDSAATMRDVHELIASGQAHRVNIAALAPADAQGVCERLERWTEVSMGVCLAAATRRAAESGARLCTGTSRNLVLQ